MTWTDEHGDPEGANRAIDRAMGIPRGDPYDGQKPGMFDLQGDRQSAAGLIAIFVLSLLLTIAFVAGCTFKALVG